MRQGQFRAPIRMHDARDASRSRRPAEGCGLIDRTGAGPPVRRVGISYIIAMRFQIKIWTPLYLLSLYHSCRRIQISCNHLAPLPPFWSSRAPGPTIFDGKQSLPGSKYGQKSENFTLFESCPVNSVRTTRKSPMKSTSFQFPFTWHEHCSGYGHPNAFAEAGTLC
jgi:hypothetical protein